MLTKSSGQRQVILSWKHLVSVVLIVLFCQTADAEYVILDRTARLDFTPLKVFFLVDHGEGLLRKYDGLIIEPFQDGSTPASQDYWHFCTAVQLPHSSSNVEYSVFLVGKNNRYQYLLPERWNRKKIDNFSGSTDQLRSRLILQKKELKSWKMELKAQQQNLKRLRTDAQVIGNTKKLNELKEFIEQEKYALASINTDIASLKSFLRKASGDFQPKGFYKRERQLTKQLAELAAAAREVESGEQVRKSRSEIDLQRRLSVIQMTRMDDYDILREELLILRKKRLRLERQYGPEQEDSFDEYEVPDDQLGN